MSNLTYKIKDLWIMYQKNISTGLWKVNFCTVNIEQKRHKTAFVISENLEKKIGVKSYHSEPFTLQSTKPKFRGRYLLKPLEEVASELVSEVALIDNGDFKNYVLSHESITATQLIKFEKKLNKEYLTQQTNEPELVKELKPNK